MWNKLVVRTTIALFILTASLGSVQCQEAAPEAASAASPQIASINRIVTIEIPFVINKEIRPYSTDDMTGVENAFKTLIVDIEKSFHEEENKQNNSTRRNLRQRKLESLLLNGETIKLQKNATVECPRYSNLDFRYCQIVTGEFGIMVYEDLDTADDSIMYHDSDIIDKYTNATKTAIENGELQSILNRLHSHLHVDILGDPKTVANQYPILPDGTDLYRVRSGFYVVSPMAINWDDLMLLREAFQRFIDELMIDIREQRQRRKLQQTEVVLDESSVDVYDFVPCQPGITSFTFCQSVLYTYDIEVTSDDNLAEYEKYSEATIEAIHDGTLQTYLDEMDGENPMMIWDRRIWDEEPSRFPQEGIWVSRTQSPNEMTFEPSVESTTTTDAPVQVEEPQEEEEDKPWHETDMLYWVIGIAAAVLVLCCCLCICCFCFLCRKQKKNRDDKLDHSDSVSTHSYQGAGVPAAAAADSSSEDEDSYRAAPRARSAKYSDGPPLKKMSKKKKQQKPKHYNDEDHSAAGATDRDCTDWDRSGHDSMALMVIGDESEHSTKKPKAAAKKKGSKTNNATAKSKKKKALPPSSSSNCTDMVIANSNTELTEYSNRSHSSNNSRAIVERSNRGKSRNASRGSSGGAMVPYDSSY